MALGTQSDTPAEDVGQGRSGCEVAVGAGHMQALCSRGWHKSVHVYDYVLLRPLEEALELGLEFPIRVDSYPGCHMPEIEMGHYSVAHMWAPSDVFGGNFG